MLDGLEEQILKDTTTIELYLLTGGVARAPTGEKASDGETIFEEMTVTVRRMSSGIVQRFLNKRKNSQIKSVQRSKTVTAEELSEDGLAMLVFCVTAWTGFRSGGKPLECNSTNVRTLLEDRSLVWIRDQIDRAVGDDTAYLGNS